MLSVWQEGSRRALWIDLSLGPPFIESFGGQRALSNPLGRWITQGALAEQAVFQTDVKLDVEEAHF